MSPRGFAPIGSLLLLGAVFSAASCMQRPDSMTSTARADPDAGLKRPSLRFITLNLAHGRALSFNQIGLSAARIRSNLTVIARVLEDRMPDVVALQEADGPSSWSGNFDHLAFLADASGFAHRFHGIHVDSRTPIVRLRYGTALLARRPLVDGRSHAFRAEPLDTKGFVMARIEFDGHDLTLVSVHLDFKTTTARVRQARMLISRLRDNANALVILGDFNCDWRQDDEALRLLARRLHLRAYEPEDAGLLTFPSHAPDRRLDWILISPELEFADYEVWPEQVSDHLAVAADIRWRNESDEHVSHR